jgi:hypothetical protein
MASWQSPKTRDCWLNFGVKSSHVQLRQGVFAPIADRPLADVRWLAGGKGRTPVIRIFAISYNRIAPYLFPMSDLGFLLASARAYLDQAEQLLSKPGPFENAGMNSVQIAKNLYRARRLRGRFFMPEIFGEPAWDILLDLYIARQEGRTVTTSSACLAGNTSQTSGLRWLKKLADAGLVERKSCPDDHRLLYVSLSDEAEARMRDLLSGIASQFSPRRLAR